MGKLQAGEAAFIQFQKTVDEISRTSPRSDAVITLLPQNLAAKEIRLRKDKLIFLGYPDESGKSLIVAFNDGSVFDATVTYLVAALPDGRRVTRFKKVN